MSGYTKPSIKIINAKAYFENPSKKSNFLGKTLKAFSFSPTFDLRVISAINNPLLLLAFYKAFFFLWRSTLHFIPFAFIPLLSSHNACITPVKLFMLFCVYSLNKLWDQLQKHIRTFEEQVRWSFFHFLWNLNTKQSCCYVIFLPPCTPNFFILWVRTYYVVYVNTYSRRKLNRTQIHLIPFSRWVASWDTLRETWMDGYVQHYIHPCLSIS